MHISLNGHPFFITDEGTTNTLPVIFLHGFPFSHEVWLDQVKVVSRSYRGIAYDLRGHGRSYVGDGQYTIDGHVDDLFALMDHLRLPPSVLVGLSMGGYIALRAYEKERNRFRGLVLSNTRSEADPNEGKTKRFSLAAQVKRNGSESFAEGFVPGLFAPAAATTHPAEMAMIRRIVSLTPPLSIAGTLIALAARTDSTPLLQEITVPTLIMTGEFDTLTPPAASEAMHERIRDSEMFIIPQAAHMSNLENPEFFDEKLLLFLKRVAADR